MTTNWTEAQFQALIAAFREADLRAAQPLPKHGVARCQMRSNPEKWFRTAPIDDRDRALLAAEPVDFIKYDQASFVRKIYHMEEGKQFTETDWVVEKDKQCKLKIHQAGGTLVGFPTIVTQPVAVSWLSMTVNVNIKATPGAGFDWGYLSTKSSNIRIFKGPRSTCSQHPWDAMILRDCSPNTDNLWTVDRVASRKWDVLAMKMCEDYDHPWVVVAVKDAGEYVPSQTSCCLP